MKTEMPEDIRRMTAEMRKAHDNPNPRPQLRRANRKAVSAAEDAAMLAQLRDRRGGQGDEQKPLNDAAVVALSSMGPSAALGHLQRLHAAAKIAKAIGIPAEHAGWARLAREMMLADAVKNVSSAALASPAAAKAYSDIKKLGIDAVNPFDNPDEAFNLALLGMMVRKPSSGIPYESVPKDAGRALAELPRRDLLKIKSDFHVEPTTVGWISETTYPKMNPNLEASMRKNFSGMSDDERFIRRLVHDALKKYDHPPTNGTTPFQRLFAVQRQLRYDGENYTPLQNLLSELSRVYPTRNNRPIVSLSTFPKGQGMANEYILLPQTVASVFDAIDGLSASDAARVNDTSVYPSYMIINDDTSDSTVNGDLRRYINRRGDEENRIGLTDWYGGSDIDNTIRGAWSTSIHELQHLFDHIFGLNYMDYPGQEYSKRPGEIRARLAQSRAILPEDERRGTLISDTLREHKRRSVRYENDWPHEDFIETGRLPDRRIIQEAAKGGNAPGESKSSGIPSGHNPALDGYSGPRIVINPSTFSNKKDALCVAWNEALRIAMEAMDYQPTSEPTEAQRRFFADTPYADDELQLRRTILARICVFDTSIS